MNLEFGTSVFVGQDKVGLGALSDLEFFVLVGVTGVGKTTTLEALKDVGWQFSSLPDRRIVTDVVMIELLAGKAVTDREERFGLTAKYRELHPGGMAQAIGMLQLNLEQIKTPLVFDGLRGLEEVSFAATTYAKSRFIVLDAPDETRVERLLGRSDAFDAISGATSSAATFEQLQAIKGINSVFSKAQLEKFASLEHQGLTASEIVAKTKIVVTERRNYDPIEARDYLLQLDSKRVLYVDTTAAKPEIIAQRIMDWV
jgi:dephospho-CoA kinase